MRWGAVYEVQGEARVGVRWLGEVMLDFGIVCRREGDGEIDVCVLIC